MPVITFQRWKICTSASGRHERDLAQAYKHTHHVAVAAEHNEREHRHGLVINHALDRLKRPRHTRNPLQENVRQRRVLVARRHARVHQHLVTERAQQRNTKRTQSATTSAGRFRTRKTPRIDMIDTMNTKDRTSFSQPCGRDQCLAAGSSEFLPTD